MSHQFFETSMGHKFYEGTMPRLTKAINSLAEAVQIVSQQRQNQDGLADLTFIDGMAKIELKKELIKRIQLIEQLRVHRDALLDQLAINHPPSPATVLCEDSK
jgi:hypothetical protein